MDNYSSKQDTTRRKGTWICRFKMVSTISLETREFALGYVQQHFSIFPLKPGSKKPILDSWDPYKRRLASNGQIEIWFSNGHAHNNIAIVTGEISRIIAFDTDGEEALAWMYMTLLLF
jgi:Bifunctional DNA primase/polymerase, N-terminal